MHELLLDISGLGILLYSPPAVKEIAEGAAYLQENFSEPADVARHVMAGQLTAFCTGTPGSFRLRFLDGPLDDDAVRAADFAIRLGLQVHEGVVCVRDLYDLMEWSAACPVEQTVTMANGWYHVTAYTSYPPSGFLGDDQVIDLHFEKVSRKPSLRWEGMPSLCE